MKGETQNTILDQIEQKRLACEMIKLGFRGSIVRVETGLAMSYVRALRREIDSTKPASAGRLPETTTILGTRQRVIEGSLFLLPYERLGGDDIYRATNIKKLIIAYEFYRSLRGPNYRRNSLLSPSEAWVLARDIRIGNAQMFDCQCGGRYLVAFGQATRAGCPFCSLNDRPEKTVLDAEQQREAVGGWQR